MHTHFYTDKKKYSKYDKDHFLVYLNEVDSEEIDSESGEPIQGFEYTGNFEDGGTMIKATEADYGQFVSGLIRNRYSADEVEAILLNIQSDNSEREEEFQDELSELNSYRDECKLIASQLLE